MNEELGPAKKEKGNQVSIRRLRGIKTRFRQLTLRCRANKTPMTRMIRDHKWRVKNLIQTPKILKIWKWNQTNAEVPKTTKRVDLAAPEMKTKIAAATKSLDPSQSNTAAAKTKYLKQRNSKIHLKRMQP